MQIHCSSGAHFVCMHYVNLPKVFMLQIFRFLVHGNVAFRAAGNPFLHAWLNKLRPPYQPPSRYVLSHTIMDAEAARAQVEDMTRLKARKRLTLLFDGWEDRL
jgi:hypothetical protein